MSNIQHEYKTVMNNSLNSEFEAYLNDWNASYINEIKKINLFNTTLTSQWSEKQKTHFARIFYHSKGHFHNFLWFIGNFSNDKAVKEIVL